VGATVDHLRVEQAGDEVGRVPAVLVALTQSCGFSAATTSIRASTPFFRSSS
jgi:hypothetical protein